MDRIASQGPAVAEPVIGGRRQRVARGVLLNTAFMVGIGLVNLLRTFAVAAFLTPAEFGVWSILFLALLLIIAVKSVVVKDKYVQQEAPDQELAYQQAFTLELITSTMVVALGFAVAPLLVLAYGNGELLLPTLALALIAPAMALSQMPIAAYYRRLQFLRQRLLLSVDPAVGIPVTLVLAIAGLGYWSLVLGFLAGAWASAIVATAFSPYKLALRYDRGILREYVSFSWPLVVATVSGLLIAQLSLFFGDLAVGLTAAGAIGLAATYSAYAKRVGQMITATLYPAVCRIVDREDLLLEAFTKSNRLGLMWGVPFGLALALFAGDLIEFVIGSRWSEAEVVLVAFGIFEAINAVAFNWTAFLRALGNTKPIAVVTVASLLTFGAGIPMLFIWELPGFVAAVAMSTVVSLAGRWLYLSRIFPGFDITVQALRGFAPAVPAIAAVLAMRVGFGLDRTLELAIFELAVFAIVTAIATFGLERPLIREATSYLRTRAAPRAA